MRELCVHFRTLYVVAGRTYAHHLVHVYLCPVQHSYFEGDILVRVIVADVWMVVVTHQVRVSGRQYSKHNVKCCVSSSVPVHQQCAHRPAAACFGERRRFPIALFVAVVLYH